jgi:hypothetical protein
MGFEVLKFSGFYRFYAVSWAEKPMLLISFRPNSRTVVQIKPSSLYQTASVFNLLWIFGVHWFINAKKF